MGFWFEPLRNGRLFYLLKNVKIFVCVVINVIFVTNLKLKQMKANRVNIALENYEQLEKEIIKLWELMPNPTVEQIEQMVTIKAKLMATNSWLKAIIKAEMEETK